MKIILSLCFSFTLPVISTFGRGVDSPDGRFTVMAGKDVAIENRLAGDTVFVIDVQAQGVERVEVSWSLDSRRVVVVEDYGRGSAVFGAWVDGAGWHKGIQPDADQSMVFRLLRHEGENQATLVNEHRTLGNWTYPDAIRVHGVLTFQNRQSVDYAYVLRFLSGSGGMSRGGFEKGTLTGINYLVQ